MHLGGFQCFSSQGSHPAFVVLWQALSLVHCEHILPPFTLAGMPMGHWAVGAHEDLWGQTARRLPERQDSSRRFPSLFEASMPSTGSLARRCAFQIGHSRRALGTTHSALSYFFSPSHFSRHHFPGCLSGSPGRREQAGIHYSREERGIPPLFFLIKGPREQLWQ